MTVTDYCYCVPTEFVSCAGQEEAAPGSDPEEQYAGPRVFDQKYVEARLAAAAGTVKFGDGNFPFIAKDGIESSVSIPADVQESTLARTGADLNVVSQRLADP